MVTRLGGSGGLNFNRQLDQTSNGLQRILNQLSSGRRLTTFSEDAAGGAISTRLESAFRGLAATNTQLQNDVGRLQTEEGGLTSINDNIQRIRELQVASGNGTLNVDDRQANQLEVNALLEDIQNTVDNTQFAGGNPLIAPGANLTALLENGVDVTDPAAADANTDAVDAAIGDVTGRRAEIGAEINATQSRVANNQVAYENTLAAFSNITDLDFAGAITAQVNKALLLQTTLSGLQSSFSLNRDAVRGILGGL
jgi:flagellin